MSKIKIAIFLFFYFIHIDLYAQCTAQLGNKIYSCAIGRSGVVAAQQKKEGDGATPAGRYALGGEIWYRADQLKAEDIPSQLPKKSIQKNDGWSDDPKKSTYNQYVKLPYEGSHERLWLNDRNPAYDLFMVIKYNMNPIIPGKGSAIFLHVAQEKENGQLDPTSGCVAFTKKDLLEIMKYIGPNTQIEIGLDNKISFLNLKVY